MKHIGVIGAGPAGTFQTVLLATLFPLDAIHVFGKPKDGGDDYPVKVSPLALSEVIANLKSWRAIEHAHLNMPGAKPFTKKKSRVVIQNIDETIKFLSKLFSNASSTKTITDSLQAYALSLSQKNQESISIDNKLHGYVSFIREELTTADLKELKFSPCLPWRSDTSLDILKACGVVFGCDGATSQVRKIIFGDTGDAREAADLTHIVQVKLNGIEPLPAIKTELKERVYFWSRDKNSNTAILNIYVNKETGDQLVGKTHKHLHELPFALQSLCESEIKKTIGHDRFRADSLRVTTTPLQIYRAKHYHTTSNKRDFLLVGEAATGVSLQHGMDLALITSSKLTNASYAKINDETGYEDLFLDSFKMAENSINHEFYDLWNEEGDRKFSLIAENVAKSNQSIPLHRPTDTNYVNSNDILAPLLPFQDDVRYAEFIFYLSRVITVTNMRMEPHIKAYRLDKYTDRTIDQFILETKNFIQEITRAGMSMNQKITFINAYQGKANFLLMRNSFGVINVAVQEMLLAYRRLIEAENTTLQFREAVNALDEKKFSVLKTKLKFLESAILKEPTPQDKKHLAVLSHFTDICLKLAANKLDQSSLQKTMDSLERALYGKKPLSYGVRTAISAVIGTLLGVLSGLGICYALPLIACPFIVGAGTTYGLLGGTLFGLFSRYPKNRDMHAKERQDIRAGFQNVAALDAAQESLQLLTISPKIPKKS